MGYIPEDTIEEILHKADIVQVISEYVLLKKRGKNYFGLCPFHQENTPSFSVAPDKQIFYCFGCHAGGDVFKFLMLKDGLSYPEAIRQIASKVGVTIPSNYTHNTREDKKRQRAYKIIAVAAKFFQKNLSNSQEAQNYLQNRGISVDMLEEFQIGYAPANWDQLAKVFTAKGCKMNELYQLGLIVKNQHGTSYYDRFRNRIILPIHDAAGRIVGFGGRAIDDGMPKYLNTPETTFFNKRHLLYGLHLARAAIRDSGYVVIMEGYMDVVAAHQYGIKNVVATLGTALTREQIKLLQRYTDEIVIAYDADVAGMQATIRGLDLVQQLGCRVKVLHIPQGKDPDEYIRAHGVEGWYLLLKSAYNLIDYKLQVALKKGIPTSASEKIAVLQEILSNLSNVKSPVELEESIKRVALALSLSWETVASELQHYNQGKKLPPRDNFAKGTNNIMNNQHKTAKGKIIDAYQQAEFLLLGIILSDFSLFSIAKKQIKEEHLEDDNIKHIYHLLLKSSAEQIKEPVRLMPYLDEQSQNLLSKLLSQFIPGDKLDILHDCIKTIKEQAGKKHRQQILLQIKKAEQAGEQDRAVKLLQQLQQLHTN